MPLDEFGDETWTWDEFRQHVRENRALAVRVHQGDVEVKDAPAACADCLPQGEEDPDDFVVLYPKEMPKALFCEICEMAP